MEVILLKPGRKPFISTSDEKDLCVWCLGMTKIGCPINKKSLQAVVKAILDKKKVVFPPDNTPSSKWVDRFLQRHPNLSYRMPENLGHLRAGIRYAHIQHFFNELEYYLKEEYGLEASEFLTKENSHRIFIYFFFFYDWEHRTGTMCPFSSLHPLRKGKEV